MYRWNLAGYSRANTLSVYAYSKSNNLAEVRSRDQQHKPHNRSTSKRGATQSSRAPSVYAVQPRVHCSFESPCVICARSHKCTLHRLHYTLTPIPANTSPHATNLTYQLWTCETPLALPHHERQQRPHEDRRIGVQRAKWKQFINPGPPHIPLAPHNPAPRRVKPIHLLYRKWFLAQDCRMKLIIFFIYIDAWAHDGYRCVLLSTDAGMLLIFTHLTTFEEMLAQRSEKDISTRRCMVNGFIGAHYFWMWVCLSLYIIFLHTKHNRNGQT